MSPAENESSLHGIEAELERLRAHAGEETAGVQEGFAKALRKLGGKRAEAAPSTQFDVVLFDVGGVLLTNGWDHVERATVLEQFDLDKAAFESRHSAPYDALERDSISMLEYLDATVFYEPRPFTPDEFVTAMKGQSKPIPSSAIGVLNEVAAADRWLVGLLNNESRLLHEYRMEHYELKQHLDVQFSSCYVALRKPQPAIYRRALDILGRSGTRVIFIDDRQSNTEAAAAAGMHAIQFQGEEKLRFDLQQIGIL